MSIPSNAQVFMNEIAEAMKVARFAAVLTISEKIAPPAAQPPTAIKHFNAALDNTLELLKGQVDLLREEGGAALKKEIDEGLKKGVFHHLSLMVILQRLHQLKRRWKLDLCSQRGSKANLIEKLPKRKRALKQSNRQKPPKRPLK